MLGSLVSSVLRSVQTTPYLGKRYAVVTGSLGVGNLGDDALLAAFLAKHGSNYRGITVLTHADTHELPGHWLLDAAERSALPDRIAVLRFPKLDLRGLYRGLIERLVCQVNIVGSAGPGPIDYVWLGGLLGLRGHMLARVRELDWAAGFADRFVYYFGDAEFQAGDADVARQLVAKMSRMQPFLAVRSEHAAELLRSVAPSRAVYSGTDIVLERYASKRRLEPSPAEQPTLVINVVRYDPSPRQVWLDAAREASGRGWRVSWVSFSDRDDLALCDELAEQARKAFGGQHASIPARQAIDSLLSARVCLASRFHCHILSLCIGVPVVSVRVFEKCSRLMSDLGLNDWQLPLDGSRSFSSLLDGVGAGAYPTDVQRRLELLAATHSRVAAAFDLTLTT